MMRAAVLLATLVLAGCAGTPQVEAREINIPVPVECREPTPDQRCRPMC